MPAYIHIHMYKFYILNFFIVGNFGVVYKAWYSQGNTQTNVAVKTTKGKYYTLLDIHNVASYSGCTSLYA